MPKSREGAKSAFLRFKVTCLMVFSTGLVSISTRLSVRETCRPSQWRWIQPSFSPSEEDKKTIWGTVFLTNGFGGGREDQKTIRGIVFPNDAALMGQPVAASLRSSGRIAFGG